MNEDKKLCVMANGAPGNTARCVVDLSKPEEFFTPREMAGLVDAMAKTGAPRWVSGARKWGTDGWIFQQARVMVGNAYRMPSQTIIILDRDQIDLFWSYVNKLEFLSTQPEFRAQVLEEVKHARRAA